MASCARCSTELGKNSVESGDYAYCNDCWERFQSVREEGVFIRSRHGNRAFEKWPYEAPSEKEWKNRAFSQVEALTAAKKKMEREEVEGVFHYQKTGSWWLIDEYLEAHPSISEDVEKELTESSLKKWLPF